MVIYESQDKYTSGTTLHFIRKLFHSFLGNYSSRLFQVQKGEMVQGNGSIQKRVYKSKDDFPAKDSKKKNSNNLYK